MKTSSTQPWARPGIVALAYTGMAIVMTWPLFRSLASEIAWDMGDPVFNSWVMMWTGGQVLAALGGNFNALHEFWNGSIFHPEPLTIAYSEHLTPQMLQVLPIYALSDNIVLSYNLLFLSTFVLSGLGTYLLVRELTGRTAAAFLAGLAFAFAPYRISQFSHVQVLSSQWMPFALWGLRRFFVTGRTRPLVGASGALAAQNLSCGYYLLFFAPFAAAYCLFEMAHRRLLGNLRVWRLLAVAAVAVAALTWPFVSPYLTLRKSGDVGVRSYEEAVQFSADTYAFATTSESARLWGQIVRAFPKGEGEGFAGFAVLAFALVGAGWGLRRAWRAGRGAGSPQSAGWQRAVLAILGVMLAMDLIALGTLLVAGSLPITVEGRPWRDTDPFLTGLFALPAAMALVPAGRRFFGGAAESAFGFFAASTVVAALLALGPRVLSAGRLLGTGPYFWLLNYVPGFDGIRVPARYLMLVALFLAVLTGYGAAAVLGRHARAGLAFVILGSIVLLAESWVAPMPTNVRLAPFGFELTPRHLAMGDQISPLYRVIHDAPGKVVLIEFPFAEPAYEILATFYAGYHRRPLVNGYSGFFPEGYLRRANFLSGIPFDLDAATKALRSSYATHAIVHEAAFSRGRGHEVTDWLLGTGARVVALHGTDKLLVLK